MLQVPGRIGAYRVHVLHMQCKYLLVLGTVDDLGYSHLLDSLLATRRRHTSVVYSHHACHMHVICMYALAFVREAAAASPAVAPTSGALTASRIATPHMWWDTGASRTGS